MRIKVLLIAAVFTMGTAADAQFSGKKQPAKGNAADQKDPRDKGAGKSPFSKEQDNPKSSKDKDRPSIGKDDDSKSNKNVDPKKLPMGGQPNSRGTPSGAQQQNLNRLKADLQAIARNSNVTPAQRQAVANDLRQILSTANPPSTQSINALANDLCSAVADGTLDPVEAMRLADDVADVLASANISQQDAQKLLRDLQTLLRASNVSQADAQRILSDVQAIVRTAQANKQSRGRN